MGYLEQISTITGKPEPTFEEKNRLANAIGQQLKQQTPEQFLARPPGVYPMENTPPEWIDKDNDDYEKAGSLYGQNPRQVDVMGSGVMKEVKAGRGLIKGAKSGLENIRKSIDLMDEPLSVRKSFGGKMRLNEKNVTEEHFLKMGYSQKEATELVSHTKGLSKGKIYWTNLSKDGNAYMQKQASLTSQGKTPIHINSKTGMSIDFSTECAKRRGGVGACPY